jgi:hypothetical protein
MLAGHRNSFAIEAELLEFHGEWIYGKLRLWVADAPFGDFDDTSDLATSARWGRTFLAASPQRTRPELDGATAADVYQLLYGQYVVDITRTAELRRRRTPAPPVWDRDPYLLDDVGESSLRDHCAVVVVRRGDGRDRVIVKAFDDEAISEVVLPPGELDATVAAYCAWVEQLRPV